MQTSIVLISLFGLCAEDEASAADIATLLAKVKTEADLKNDEDLKSISEEGFSEILLNMLEQELLTWDSDKVALTSTGKSRAEKDLGV